MHSVDNVYRFSVARRSLPRRKNTNTPSFGSAFKFRHRRKFWKSQSGLAVGSERAMCAGFAVGCRIGWLISHSHDYIDEMEGIYIRARREPRVPDWVRYLENKKLPSSTVLFPSIPPLCPFLAILSLSSPPWAMLFHPVPSILSSALPTACTYATSHHYQRHMHVKNGCGIHGHCTPRFDLVYSGKGRCIHSFSVLCNVLKLATQRMNIERVELKGIVSRVSCWISFVLYVLILVRTGHWGAWIVDGVHWQTWGSSIWKLHGLQWWLKGVLTLGCHTGSKWAKFDFEVKYLSGIVEDGTYYCLNMMML